MLTGQAKKDYQREYMRDYMRKRRQGLNRSKQGLNKKQVLTQGLNKPVLDPIQHKLVRPKHSKPTGPIQQSYNPMMVGYVPPGRGEG